MQLTDENLYYVGGVVRDEILNTQNFDTDFCFEGDAIKFANKHKLNIIKTNPDFGTVRVNISGKAIDIASTRTESYPRKGHLPKVENIGCPLKMDLKRRDFTVNAMAKSTVDGNIIDYFNGLDDIKDKKLKILHENSFIDDPTRIIRGLKFSVRFGFSLDSNTKLLQDKYLNNINYDMSYHRVRKELIETFSLNIPEAYDIFVEQNIYKLLGKNTKAVNIKGNIITDSIKDIITDNKWFIYVALFLSEAANSDEILLPLTRAEKRILDYTNRLKYQKVNNNTPKESIILRELLDNAK